MIALFLNFGINIEMWGERKIRTSFKTLVSNKAKIWRLRESQSSDKLSGKMFSSNHMQ